jgi:hypothetical protein
MIEAPAERLVAEDRVLLMVNLARVVGLKLSYSSDPGIMHHPERSARGLQ